MIKHYKRYHTNNYANKKQGKTINTENRKEFVTSSGGSTEEFAVSMD